MRKLISDTMKISTISNKDTVDGDSNAGTKNAMGTPLTINWLEYCFGLKASVVSSTLVLLLVLFLLLLLLMGAKAVIDAVIAASISADNWGLTSFALNFVALL